MTDNLEEWVNTVLIGVTGTHRDEHGGRIVAGLGLDSNSERRRLGALIMAACAQEYDERFELYLAEQNGTTTRATPTPSAAPVTAPSEARPKLTRPNGDVYYARKWNDFWDVDVLKKGRETEQYILLIGPPGTGKTAMAEGAFSDDLLTIVITGETRVGELVGGFVPDGKTGWRWVPGPLQIAVQEGRPILIDEILLADPKVLSVLYPLMDGRGFLDVTENPEIGILPAKDGFYIVGAGNPNVPGAKMSEALVSRFPVHVEVTTDWDLLVELGVDENIVNFAASLAARQSGSGSVSWAPQFRELMAFDKMEKTWGRAFAMNNLMRIVPRGDFEEVKTIASTAFDSALLKAAKI